MDTLISSHLLDENLFTYYTNGLTGAVTFGGINYAHTSSNHPIWISLYERKYWTVELISVLIGDFTLSNPSISPHKAIIDTGTYLIYGPSVLVKTIYSLISDCDTSSLPTLSFTFRSGAEEVTVTLESSDYVRTLGGDCVVGIAEDSSEASWTLGQVFLEKFVTIFDRGNDRIGFLPKAVSG